MNNFSIPEPTNQSMSRNDGYLNEKNNNNFATNDSQSQTHTQPSIQALPSVSFTRDWGTLEMKSPEDEISRSTFSKDKKESQNIIFLSDSPEKLESEQKLSYYHGYGSTKGHNMNDDTKLGNAYLDPTHLKNDSCSPLYVAERDGVEEEVEILPLVLHDKIDEPLQKSIIDLKDPTPETNNIKDFERLENLKNRKYEAKRSKGKLLSSFLSRRGLEIKAESTSVQHDSISEAMIHSTQKGEDEFNKTIESQLSNSGKCGGVENRKRLDEKPRQHDMEIEEENAGTSADRIGGIHSIPNNQDHLEQALKRYECIEEEKEVKDANIKHQSQKEITQTNDMDKPKKGKHSIYYYLQLC